MHRSSPAENEKNQYLEFLAEHNSASLSTIGENGQPEISYVPFVTDLEKNFFIFVSSLARHSKNLFNYRKAGFMLIEPEENSENIFARKRVIFDCDVFIVERDSQDWKQIILKFNEIAGEIMETLIMLPDFHLFRLNPKSGRFIKGFGNAFSISGDKMDKLIHLNPKK